MNAFSIPYFSFVGFFCTFLAIRQHDTKTFMNEQYWIDMAACPAPSLKYWSPCSFGKHHFGYQWCSIFVSNYKYVITWSYPILRTIPLIHERNALREVLPQRVGKFPLKSIVKIIYCSLMREELHLEIFRCSSTFSLMTKDTHFSIQCFSFVGFSAPSSQ